MTLVKVRVHDHGWHDVWRRIRNQITTEHFIFEVTRSRHFAPACVPPAVNHNIRMRLRMGLDDCYRGPADQAHWTPLCKNMHSPPASPARMAPASPGCCAQRATKCMASSAARRLSTQVASIADVEHRNSHFERLRYAVPSPGWLVDKRGMRLMPCRQLMSSSADRRFASSTMTAADQCLHAGICMCFDVGRPPP